MGDTSSPTGADVRDVGSSGQHGSSFKSRRHSSTKSIGKARCEAGKKSKERKPSHSRERSSSSGAEVRLLQTQDFHLT